MIESIISLVQKLFSLLPQDPFMPFLEDLAKDIQAQEWVGILNYFIPLKEMLSIASAWILAVGVYVVVRTFVRKLTN